jgi:hypothetical protein
MGMSLADRIKIKPETAEALERILKRGNVAEVKREQGNIVVIEIERKVRDKTVITG